MRVAVIAPAPVPGTLGGEDQVGRFLCNTFMRLGHEASLIHPSSGIRDFSGFDFLLNNGCWNFPKPTKHPAKLSVFWHFNTVGSISDALALGYDVYLSNTKKNVPDDWGYMPLAADVSHLGRVSDLPADFPYDVCYIGNYTESKGVERIHRYVIDPCRKFGKRFALYGGERWKEVLPDHYLGIFPPKNWPYLASLARVFINFNSESQAEAGMINDRIFWYLAARVSHIITDDTPEQRAFFAGIPNIEYCEEDLEEKIRTALSRPSKIITQTEWLLYDARVRRMLLLVTPEELLEEHVEIITQREPLPKNVRRLILDTFGKRADISRIEIPEYNNIIAKYRHHKNIPGKGEEIITITPTNTGGNEIAPSEHTGKGLFSADKRHYVKIAMI